MSSGRAGCRPRIRATRGPLRSGGTRPIRRRVPGRGVALFDELRAAPDPDVAWIVRENLRTARLRAVVPDERAGPVSGVCGTMEP